jgi:hypothetical protein
MIVTAGDRDEHLAEEPHVTPMSLTQYADFLGQSSSTSTAPTELNSSTTIEPGTPNTGRTWLRNDAAVASSIDPDRRTVG